MIKNIIFPLTRPTCTTDNVNTMIDRNNLKKSKKLDTVISDVTKTIEDSKNNLNETDKLLKTLTNMIDNDNKKILNDTNIIVDNCNQHYKDKIINNNIISKNIEMEIDNKKN